MVRYEPPYLKVEEYGSFSVHNCPFQIDINGSNSLISFLIFYFIYFPISDKGKRFSLTTTGKKDRETLTLVEHSKRKIFNLSGLFFDIGPTYETSRRFIKRYNRARNAGGGEVREGAKNDSLGFWCC